MRKAPRATIVGALGALAFLAPATTTYALWTSSATATLSVTTGAPAPTPPGGVSCNGSSDSISLFWAAVPGATEYRIYRLNGTAYVQIATVTGTTSPVFTEGSMLEPKNPNDKYNLVVRAYNSAGAFADSAVFEIRFKQKTGCS